MTSAEEAKKHNKYDLERAMSVVDRLMQYGVSSILAQKVDGKGLTLSKLRSFSKKDLVETFRLTRGEVDELKTCIMRFAIESDTVRLLLDRSNHTCCICKGAKGGAIVLHHIEPYEVSQNNNYSNLAVLCPNDHDRAHRSGALSMGLSAEDIRRAKTAWEHRVEVANAQAAAKVIEVDDSAIDYVNVMRIEEMCLRLLGRIPSTGVSASLRRAKILGPDLGFDERYVRKHISGGSYLFDYANAGETEHYRQLLRELAKVVIFDDLSEAARSGIRKLMALEGKYVFFIGAVDSKQPDLPITRKTPPLVLRHKARGVVITWDCNANYLISMSAIGRQGRRNRYIIYGRVSSVLKGAPKGPIEVSVSPLLIAQPSAHVDRTPAIAWRRRWSEEEEDEDDEFTN
jgi:hypothetical protein